MAEVTFSLDIDRIDNIVSIFLEGVVEEDVERRTKGVTFKVRELIQERAINGGDLLAQSVYGQVSRDGPRDFSAVIASNSDHALWFEEGTGVHGPRSQVIRPRGKKYMMFRPYFHNKIVFAKAVVGQKPQHVFRDGLEQGFNTFA